MKMRSVVATAALVSLCTIAIGQQLSGQVVELQPQTPAPAADPSIDDESSQLWFVELSGAPVADGGSLASVKSEKQAFRNNARAAGLKFKERYAYDTLFNGLSIAIDKTQLSKLSRIAGVKAIYMVDTVAIPRTTESSPELFTALAMTGADVVQNDLGLDGTGVKVAVMDTGIDIDHPDFGGSGTDDTTDFPSARVIAGWDFVGDAFNADPSSASYNPDVTPDAIPDDCAGHGTHVSGIVGANGTVKGVAPGVTFGAYRVFGCAGSTTADIMILAMERALADHMDVLNMSIGSSFQWPQYPTAQAASRLVNKGMVVVASIGNSGANGLYAAGAPGLGDKVIGVASFDNTHSLLPYFTVSPDDTKIGYSAATGAPAPPTSGSAAMARTGTTSSTADACAALAAGSLSGTVALIRRGTCSFYQKSFNAQNAGAIGVVLYNNVAGRINPTVAGSPAITIPVVAVSNTEGALINGRLATDAVTMTWTALQASFVSPTGGRISSFSSYGLSPDLVLKPDIGAPGGNIYSTWPIELGSYAVLSGTSMASPHVAGTAALLLQAAPATSAQKVRGILQNSAVPKLWSLNPGTGLLDHAHRQGAGMVRIDNAIVTATRIEPAKLSLGESQAGPVSATLTLRNTGSTVVTYTPSAVNAVSTGANTFTPSFFGSDAAAAFSAPNVIVAPGASAAVDVTITPATGPANGMYGGYLVFTPDDGSATLRVPFAGYIGDYQARVVLTPTANGFPWLAQLNAAGTSYNNRPAGGTYTMVGNDIPFFLIHLDHQSRRLRLEVFATGSGKVWHRAYQEDYLPRNSTATGFFAFPWDGVTTAGNKSYLVPNGTYVVKLSVLKALGDAANPADTETWTSPVITIARP
ncbi:MAG: S8 family serine peptidase [Luteimonas sp.]